MLNTISTTPDEKKPYGFAWPRIYGSPVKNSAICDIAFPCPCSDARLETVHCWTIKFFVNNKQLVQSSLEVAEIKRISNPSLERSRVHMYRVSYQFRSPKIPSLH